MCASIRVCVSVRGRFWFEFQVLGFEEEGERGREREREIISVRGDGDRVSFVYKICETRKAHQGVAKVCVEVIEHVFEDHVRRDRRVEKRRKGY